MLWVGSFMVVGAEFTFLAAVENRRWGTDRGCCG